MEITRDNLKSKLPLIQESIDKCDFISYDAEFTGVSLNDLDRGNQYDSMETRYQKWRIICNNYLALQIGISAFIYDPVKDGYTVRPFVFDVFPRFTLAHNPSFLMQTKAMEFLAEHDFNFNKWSKEGLNCCHLVMKKQIISDIEETINGQAKSPIVLLNLGKESLQEIEECEKQVREWINSEEKKLDIEFTNNIVKHYFLKKEINKRFGTLGIVMGKKKDDKTVSISKSKKFKMNPKPEEKKVAEEELRTKIENEIIDVLGASLIIEIISKSKKPIITHNGAYDIGFIFAQFIDFMPPTYLQFKQNIHQTLGPIYDTKLIGQDYEKDFHRTDLQSLYQKGTSLNLSYIEFRLDLEQGFPNLDSTVGGDLHNAGYDAYITGKLFAILARLIQLDKINTAKVRKKLIYSIFHQEEEDEEVKGGEIKQNVPEKEAKVDHEEEKKMEEIKEVVKEKVAQGDGQIDPKLMRFGSGAKLARKAKKK